jgi:predicted enzyme related to lactoylglutathione lyase
MKLAALKIITQDVDALVRFYRAITRTEAVGGEHYAEFASGGIVLAICSQQVSDLFGAGAATAAENRSLVISFEVADVDAERQRLAPLVGRFVQEPVDQPWGHRTALFRDPDGNLVHLFTALAQAPAPAGPRKFNHPYRFWINGHDTNA